MPAVLRPMHHKRLVPGFAAAALLVLVGTPAQTLASCVQLPTIVDAVGSADIVFVGTVTATAERNTWATVAVEEIWKGPDLPPVLQVRGGPGGNTATSVDREFVPGTRYLFVPFKMESGFASDNICSATRPWDDTLAGFRPPAVRGPIGGTPQQPAGFEVADAVLPIGVALLVACVLLIVGLAARSRQRG